MNGAFGAGFANTPDDEGLDVSCLDLYESHCSCANCVECFPQGGNRDVPAQGMRIHDTEVCVGDGDASGLRHISRMEDRIVMNHNYSIARRMHVELDSLGAQLERALKGRNRVFGKRFVRATVRDPERAAAF